MDANFLKKQINKWVRENINAVSGLEPVSLHLNELEGVDYDKNTAIERFLEVLQILVQEIEAKDNPVKVGLVIPLRSANRRISARIPRNIDRIRNLLSQEPPSIYMESWDIPKRYYPIEEYRCPVNFFPLSDYHDNLFAYYRESRDRFGMNNLWEFAKGIYIEYFPEGE